MATNKNFLVKNGLEVGGSATVDVDLVVTGDVSAATYTGITLGGSLAGDYSDAKIVYSSTAPLTPTQGAFYFDSLDQKMKVYTGSAWVDAVPSSGGGGVLVASDAIATLRKYTYTAAGTTNIVSGAEDDAVVATAIIANRLYEITTVGDTDFTLIGASANTIGVSFIATDVGIGTGTATEVLNYVVDGSQNIEVFVNGIKQVEGSANDYVATTGTSVSFTYNLEADFVVDVQVYELLTSANYYLKTETDTLLGDHYLKTEVYTQTETDLLLDDYYLKTETDTLLGDHYLKTEVYNQTETDLLLDDHYLKTEVYTQSETDFLLANGSEMSAVDAVISKTAVDVFVYDTTKDSDGGAWRKRTQHTSWYNETLNTATRGARKDFPAVAVIVAEADKVTIYDGDDPAMPMWMVFNQAGWNVTLIIGADNTSTSMINGKLAVGTAPNAQGLVLIDFILDRSQAHLTASNYGGVDRTSLALRNAPGHTFSAGTALGDPTGNIASNAVNDVAMTVLPNAPIDPATGLPIPTIAVATDGGVSVIKDDGTVVDITHTASVYTGAKNISFNRNQVSYSSQQSGSSSTFWRQAFIDIPTTDVTGAYLNNIPGITAYDARGNTGNDPALNVVDNLGDLSNTILRTAHGRAFGFTDKITLLDATSFPAAGAGLPSVPNSMVAYVTSDYNTGWMPGNIKMAALSDTDDTNVTGANLIATSTLYSTDRLASHTYTSGSATFSLTEDSNAGTTAGYVWILFNVPLGKSYAVSIQCDTAFTPDGETRLVNVTTGVDVFPEQGTTSLRTLTFDHNDASAGVILYSSPVVGSTVTYTLSISEAEEDRSVNSKGLQVFGTVTKTPVATGADLVGYSGFSSTTYLAQPYNSDLDFGTGDFSIMGWINVGTSVSAYASILSRVLSNNAETNAWSLRINSSDNNYYLYTNNTSVFTSPLTRSTWQFLTVARRSGVVYFYVDGAFRTTGPMANTITNVGASVVVGYESTHHLGNSSVALWRISATAPSAEQISKIYNDEKVLFQENAQATLYGADNYVRGLAYDESTEMLHVGTLDGRSDFQGLRRVDNTTRAVGTAISAVDGFIVEE